MDRADRRPARACRRLRGHAGDGCRARGELDRDGTSSRAAFKGRRRDGPRRTGAPPGQYLTRRLPGPLGRPDAAHAARRVDVHDRRRVDEPRQLDAGTSSGAAERDDHARHPLRHEVVEARHGLGGRLGRHAARRRRARRRVRRRVLRRRLHDEPAARGRHRRQGLGRVRLRRRAARPRARRPGAAARPAPLLLEEREVGARASAPRRGRARLLGVATATTSAAIRGRSSGTGATDAGCVAEVAGPRRRRRRACARCQLDVAGWAGHRAGQHVDVRLTAEDGYQAQRSYSIASAPDDAARAHGRAARRRRGLALPRRRGAARATASSCAGRSAATSSGTPGDGGPLLLVGGGSGVVPLMAMLRHRAAAGSDVPTRLLYSSRTLEDVIYREELDELAAAATASRSCTR